MTRRIRISASAKINLYLAIGATRPDGYHDLETVFQAISLADELVVEPSSELSLVCDPTLDVPETENLAYQAAERFASAHGRSADVKISLSKQIPSGAGLGGGSSDAAAVIVALAEMWDLPSDDDIAMETASSLGADVPFFLHGGTALFGDRGDTFVESLPTPDLDLVVIWPGEPVSTAEAYKTFDESSHAAPPGAGAIREACISGDAREVASALYNNMLDASSSLLEAVPAMLTWVQSMEGVLGATISGSGSAVYAICENKGSAEEIVEAARSKGQWARYASSLRSGACSVVGKGVL